MKQSFALLLFSLICNVAYAQTANVETRPMLSAPGGRYVFGQISTFRRDQYLLDTQTGRVWTLNNVGTATEEHNVLVPVPFMITVPTDSYQFTPFDLFAPAPRR